MSSRRTYHVMPHRKGGWQVKAEDAQRATSVHDTKADVVARAKELAKAKDLGQVVIRGKDGQIQTEFTYGKDPYPPEG